MLWRFFASMQPEQNDKMEDGVEAGREDHHMSKKGSLESKGTIVRTFPTLLCPGPAVFGSTLRAGRGPKNYVIVRDCT